MSSSPFIEASQEYAVLHKAPLIAGSLILRFKEAKMFPRTVFFPFTVKSNDAG